LQIKTKIVSCHTDDSKPVKQEVNGTVIFPPLVFPDLCPTKQSTLHFATSCVHCYLDLARNMYQAQTL